MALAGERMQGPSPWNHLWAQDIPWGLGSLLIALQVLSGSSCLRAKPAPRSKGSWLVPKSTLWKFGISLPLGHKTQAGSRVVSRPLSFLQFHFKIFIFLPENFHLLRISRKWIGILSSRRWEHLGAPLTPQVPSSLFFLHINSKYFTLLPLHQDKNENKIQPRQIPYCIHRIYNMHKNRAVQYFYQYQTIIYFNKCNLSCEL